MKGNKFIEKWSKMRAMGSLKYSIYRGALCSIGTTLGGMLACNFDADLTRTMVYIISGFIGGGVGAKLYFDKSEKKYGEMTETI